MNKEEFTDFTLFDPLEDGIVLKRDERGVWTNIPHLVTHHSPTGFEFGYSGSGPADLALNICEIILNRLDYKGSRVKCWEGDCWDAAWNFHQEFKWQFISKVDRGGTIIPIEKVEAWFKAKLILDHAEVAAPQHADVENIEEK